MKTSRLPVNIVLTAILIGLFAVPAWADAIDGNWCLVGAGAFTITGPQIVTPTGHKTQGD